MEEYGRTNKQDTELPSRVLGGRKYIQIYGKKVKVHWI